MLLQISDRLSFINKEFLNKLMRKELATFKALITGNASIRYIDKTPIKRTPGDTTEVTHQ
jgi:hypothetical protein